MKFSTFFRCVLLSLLVSMALTGCNTVHGFGKDIQKAGEKIEGAGSK